MALPTSIRSPADVANYALTMMGYKLQVGSLLDGSEHAQHLLNVYAQTRDAMLEAFDYDFAEAIVSLGAPLKTGPVGGYFPPNLWTTAMPPVGFLYEYAYPDDGIKIRSIRPMPQFVVNYRPNNYPFTEGNDTTFTPAQRVILCNVPNAIAVYTRRVTDPTTWDVSFASALAARLSVLLGPVLVGLESAKLTTGESAQSTMQAGMTDR